MASRTAAATTKVAATKGKGGAGGKPAPKANGGKTKTPLREPEWKTDVVESKVNAQVLQEELRAHGLETRGATMVLVARLEKAVCSAVQAPAIIVRCDDCHGRSSSVGARCPFCGSTDEVVIKPAPEPEGGTPAADGAAGAEASGGAPTGQDEAPASQDEPEAAGGGEEPSVDDEQPAAAGGFGGPRFDAGSDDDDAPAGDGAASEPPASGSIVLASDDAAAAAASAGVQPSEDEVKDLDRRIARVRELALAFVANGWDLGHELVAIHDSKAWLARRLGSGAPKYRSFSAFVEGEFGNDQSWARKFMAVAKAFTRDQVLARGISRMVLVVQLPEGVREQILANEQAMAAPVAGLKAMTKLVKGGTPVPEAVATVIASKASKSAPPPPVDEEPDAGGDEPASDEEEEDDGAAAAGAGDGEAKPATAKPATKPARPTPKKAGGLVGFSPRPEKSVNVIAMPGRFQIKMFALPKANKGPLGKKRRAFTIAEHPRGTFAFDNGAELRIGIHQNTGGGIFLVCELTPPTAG